MNRAILFSTVVLSLALYGCGSSSTTTPTAPEKSPPATDAHGEHEHGEHSDHEHGAHDDHAHDGQTGQSAMAKMSAALAKLSTADRASAEKQHLCPVSGEMLGVMGPPRKVEVNGEVVWVCCSDCEEQLLADPNEYLAKLAEGRLHE